MYLRSFLGGAQRRGIWPRTVNDSDVQGGWATGSNVMDLDPVFVYTNKWNADVHVQPVSPCIDAGNSDYIPTDLGDLDHDGDTSEQIPFDLDGRERVIDGDEDGTATVDMGAYEYLRDPNALTYILAVEIAGANGRVTGPGIDCPGVCAGEYYAGSELRIYAESSTQALFDQPVAGRHAPRRGVPGRFPLVLGARAGGRRCDRVADHRRSA